MNRTDRDIDFEAVWDGIAERIALEPVAARERRLVPGPLLAVAVFAAVVAVGAALLAVTAGDSTGDLPDAAQAPGAMALDPRQPFEAVWHGPDGIAGRIIWRDADVWKVERIDRTAGGFEPIYVEARRNDDRYVDYPDGADPSTWSVFADTAAPYESLLAPLSAAESWRLAGGGPERSIEPTHPLAVAAVTDGDLVLELDRTGLPVRLVGSDVAFEMVSVDYRQLVPAELFARAAPTDLVSTLLAGTSAEQAEMLADGFVSLHEYERAVERAAECAGLELAPARAPGALRVDSSGMSAECIARHSSAVEAVWLAQSADGGASSEVAAEPLEPGGAADLADPSATAEGEGWHLSLAGTEAAYCFRFDTESTASEGCEGVEDWIVADGMTVAWGMSREDDGVQGELFGFAVDRVVAAEFRYTSGEMLIVGVEELGDVGIVAFADVWSVEETGFVSHVTAIDAAGEVVATYDVFGALCDTPDIVLDVDGLVPADVADGMRSALAAACE